MVEFRTAGGGNRLRLWSDDGENLQVLTFVSDGAADEVLKMQEEALKYRGRETRNRVAEAVAATHRKIREQLTARDESGASAGFGVGQLVVTKGGVPLADQAAAIQEFKAACGIAAMNEETREKKDLLGPELPAPETDPAAKRMKDLRSVTELARSPGNANANEYMFGMANGLTLALAIMEDRAPDYLSSPFKPNPELPTPVSDIASYLVRQIEWSKRTFGPAMRTGGIIEHIGKELAEVKKDPFDLMEWIDIIILALDGYWRHGGSAHRLMDVLCAKQQINLARQWPNWRDVPDDTAIEHKRG